MANGTYDHVRPSVRFNRSSRKFQPQRAENAVGRHIKVADLQGFDTHKPCRRVLGYNRVEDGSGFALRQTFRVKTNAVYTNTVLPAQLIHTGEPSSQIPRATAPTSR